MNRLNESSIRKSNVKSKNTQRLNYLNSHDSATNHSVPVINVSATLDGNYVNASILDRHVQLLIDSGASLSCCDLKFLRTIGIDKSQLLPVQDVQRVKSFDGEIKHILGRVNL